jgi:hypothetical protein
MKISVACTRSSIDLEQRLLGKSRVRVCVRVYVLLN